MKTIQIKYIKELEEVKSLRNKSNEEAIGKYMEKFESGTTKPIQVKEINRQEYILIDGKHRLEALRRLKRNKVDVECLEINEEEIYSKAVEANQEHGIPFTKEEEERILINLVEQGKTQQEIAKVFHVGQSAISNRINRNPILKKSLSDKINISTVNELLQGKNQSEVANNYGITQGRVSQIWNDWLNEVNELYETGTPKQDIVERENERGLKLSLEKLNEFIEEDYNKLIIGNCLEEIPKLPDEIIDCLIIDPPYGINYQSNYRKIKHDYIEGDTKEAFELLNNSLKKVLPKMKKNSHVYIFTSWKVFDKVKPIIEQYFDIKSCLIWNKNNWSAGDLNNYADKYEMIIFASQGKKRLCCEMRPVNVLNYDRESTEEHPTRKPVKLLKELIINSTKEKELVVDYFAGSGSTLEAAQELNRKWIGIEKNANKTI